MFLGCGISHRPQVWSHPSVNTRQSVHYLITGCHQILIIITVTMITGGGWAACCASCRLDLFFQTSSNISSEFDSSYCHVCFKCTWYLINAVEAAKQKVLVGSKLTVKSSAASNNKSWFISFLLDHTNISSPPLVIKLRTDGETEERKPQEVKCKSKNRTQVSPTCWILITAASSSKCVFML